LKEKRTVHDIHKEPFPMYAVAIIAVMAAVFFGVSSGQESMAGSATKGNLVTQTIELQEGWNYIGFNVQPRDSNVSAVFASMNPSEGDAVYDENDGLTAEYTNGAWTGFEEINTKKGYKVKVSSPKTLTVSGNRINTQRAIPLMQGWNLVPYYPTEERTPYEAFASIKDCLIEVQDANGNTFKDSGMLDVWTNDIGMIKPGVAYRVTTSESCVLKYD
jgi:hypothetical protein